MFNLFKKTEKQTEVEVAESNPTKYPAVVHEIHNEFLTAGDKILEEANAILNDCRGKSIEKGKRLSALGFNRVQEVKEAISFEMTAELGKMVRYYQINYPNNKFITEGQVQEICKKYGLVCGGVSLYKGFVPEKKLSEIESFKLKKKEQNTLVSDNGLCFEDAEIRKQGNYHHIYKINERDNYIYAYQSDDGNDFYSKDSKNIFGYEGIGAQRFTIASKSLQICAPIGDMAIDKSKQFVDGYKIKNIPDPVVLQPVKGGYLIVCAWGDEASDELVVNQINN